MTREGVMREKEAWGKPAANGRRFPILSRLIKLIGLAREIFLKGRRCENHGFGMGTFVYYSRVVENQEIRILEEIIKVSKKPDAGKGVTDTLESVKAETQFSKALALAKDAFPQSLLINGFVL